MFRPKDEGNQRVTVRNTLTGKKLSGNAGVMKRNLAKWMACHPDWVVAEPSKKHRKYATKRKREDEPAPTIPRENQAKEPLTKQLKVTLPEETVAPVTPQ